MKSDFELIMEAIDALPLVSPARKAKKEVDKEKLRVIGNRDEFMKAMDRDSYTVKCVLGDFIENLDEDLTYYVSSGTADGVNVIGAAMKKALENLSVPVDSLYSTLFCVIGSDLTSQANSISSIMTFLNEMPEDVDAYWGTVYDETIAPGYVKVILVAS